MRNAKRLLAVLAVGATAIVTLFYTALAQAPQQIPPTPTATAAVPPILANYQPVTVERLKNPEAGNWLMIRRTYDGWGYSPLNQINTGNVSKLKPVWGLLTGENRVHEAAPIVNNGVMFISMPANKVMAIDVKAGITLWTYTRPRPQGANVPHDTSRGVALFGDKVYFAAGEAVIVALDAKTGREVWAASVADNTSGYYISLAPLIADNKLMVGTSGGELGVRGFVAALDLDTGKELWRTFTVPAPGEPGSETWPAGGEHWKTGGASVWVTGNYDQETNTAYWGTGNGGPWMGDQRPGDNLYTSSTIALDVATGKIKGHFQYHPNDSWDWDEVSPPILVDYRRNGRTIKGLINVARNGYLWFLDRTTGPIKFVEGKPYVNQNVFRSLDPVTGRPDVNPDRKPGTGKTADFCPGLHGGKNWPPIAFSPQTRMIYVPANNNICGSLTGAPVTYTRGRGFTGTTRGAGGAPAVDPKADHFGEVQAWNVDTGKKVWTHNYPKSPNWGSMLATAGGVVFSGGTNDRKIHAFNAENGKLLWESPTPSGILAPPTSFIVDGKQYIAVLSGWGGDSAGMQGTLERGFPGQYPPVPTGGSIWVYALD